MKPVAALLPMKKGMSGGPFMIHGAGQSH